MGKKVLYSAAERRELWERWRAGESLTEISLALERQTGSVFGHLALHGGIEPRRRQRDKRHLTLNEREEISRGVAAGDSYRAIARRVGRHPSTVCREIQRNGGARRYRAAHADRSATRRAERPKMCRLATYGALRKAVASKLAWQWSPEQISGWLRQEFPTEPHMQISHETIYRSLFIQARGVLKQELRKHLRTRRSMRHCRGSSAKGQGRGQIVDAVAIRERPPEVQDRAVPGHWEGDLIAGTNNSHIATLVERRSRYVMLVKVNGKDAATVEAALRKKIVKLPAQLKRSLTWDRGTEMAKHKQFTVATGVQVYFCDPRSPWQRGSNENTNGLLRQYFPKGTDLSQHSQAHLNRIALRLNQRPRKTLDWATPADKLAQTVALTG